MPTQFDLLAEEFVEELRVLDELLTKTQRFRGPRTGGIRVAASNAAVLLLAANFEEYIRQIARAYCELLQLRARSFADLPTELGRAAWDRSTSSLRAMKLDRVRLSSTDADNSLKVLREFCVAGDHTVPVADAIALNQHNMTSAELSAMFGRLGLKDYAGTIGKHRLFQRFFGVSAGGRARTEFTIFLDGFYRVRNTAAHSVASLRASGAVDLRRNLSFFETVAEVSRLDLNAR